MHAILSHPALVDCRRLFLRDYEIYINIGVHDFEKKAEQRVILNVDLYIPLRRGLPRAISIYRKPSATTSLLQCSCTRRSLPLVLARRSRMSIQIATPLALKYFG
mgnify:CR=1 FL=1